jgi:hypothetical protein
VYGIESMARYIVESQNKAKSTPNRKTKGTPTQKKRRKKKEIVGLEVRDLTTDSISDLFAEDSY